MASSPRRICVTGGAGFIGSHLVRALVERDLEVTVLDNLSVGRRENLPAKVELIEGDILDGEPVRRAIDDCEVVFHLAARVAVRSSFDFAVEDVTTNVVGTTNVLKTIEDAPRVRKVIMTSSMAVYADAAAATTIAEDHETDPISPYGVSKLAGERLTHLMCGRAGVDSVVLRLFNTFGPGQSLSPYVGVVTIFIDALSRGESPTIFGDGEQRRDFVHVRDVVRALLGAMDAEIASGTYNIGSGRGRSVNEVFRDVRRVLGSAVEPARADAVPGELRNSVADITAAGRDLGYEPHLDFGDSLDEVIDEIRGRRG